MRGKGSERGSAVAWLALALAILAAVVAVVAYYRSGGPPLEHEVAREVEEATTALRSRIAEMEKATTEARERIERRGLASDAREELVAARDAIAERGDVETIRSALARAGDDLRAMFDGQGAEVHVLPPGVADVVQSHAAGAGQAADAVR
jgi:hypothetical protein